MPEACYHVQGTLGKLPHQRIRHLPYHRNVNLLNLRRNSQTLPRNESAQKSRVSANFSAQQNCAPNVVPVDRHHGKAAFAATCSLVPSFCGLVRSLLLVSTDLA